MLSFTTCILQELNLLFRKFALNLKFCGLRVHDLSLSCWGVWYDELELLQTCSEQVFTYRIFIFQNFKMKSSSVMKYSYQSHMHEAYKETIHLHAVCLILSFAKFSDPFEFLVMLSWSRITYTPLPLAKSSTPEDSMSIPSTLPYSFYAPHSIGISSKFFSKKGMSYEFKKKWWHMKAHEKMDTWRSMEVEHD